MTIKMFAASIDVIQFLQLNTGIECSWNVAGVRGLKNENDSEDENTLSDDNHNDYAVNE